KPAIGALISDFVQMLEELPIGIVLADRSKLPHHVVRLDGVNEHAFEAPISDPFLVDQPGNERNRAHLAEKRRIEADLVDPIYDLWCGLRDLRAFRGIDVHDDDVAALTFVNEREQGGIAHISAVPIELAVDLHRLMQQGKAGGREYRSRADL